MHHGPSVSCLEFKSRKKKMGMSDMFCLNCIHYENVEGISICDKDHRPGVACGAFRAKSGELTVTA